MDLKDNLDKVSKWQCNINTRHPLFCQIGTRVVAAIIIASLGWLWVKAKPIFQLQYPSQSEAKIVFSNEGLLPATDIYNIASGPTVTLQKPNIVSGEEYAVVDGWTQQGFSINVKNLPQNQKVIVDVATADTTRPIGIIDVKKE